MAFSEFVSEIMGEMSKEAEIGLSSHRNISEQRRDAAGKLQNGIIGNVAYEEAISGLEAQGDAVNERLNDRIRALEEKYASTRKSRFGLNPNGLEEFSSMLRAVDITEDEALDMFGALKTAGDYTKARAVCAAARRLGLDLEDDTPRYLSTLDKAVSTFAQYCRSMGGGADGAEAYADNWAQIVAVSMKPVLEAEEAWKAGKYASARA